jgi:hypothetical protein
MNYKAVLLFVLFLPIISHASPERLAPPISKKDIKAIDVVIPEIGIVTSAEIGEPIYRQFSRLITTSFRAAIKNDVNSDMDRGYKLNLTAGQSAELQIRPSTGAPMICFPAKGTGILGLFGDNNVLGCLIDTTKSGFFNASTFTNYDVYFNLKSPIEYTLEPAQVVKDNLELFRFEILYQGVSKGEVKIAYREFVNNMARPSFNQDVSYELSPGGTALIGFKGMRMRVLKADSQSIQYILDKTVPALN